MSDHEKRSLLPCVALRVMAIQAMEERCLLQQVNQRPIVERVHQDIRPVVIHILEPLPEGLQQPPNSQSLWWTVIVFSASAVLAGHAIDLRLNNIKACAHTAAKEFTCSGNAPMSGAGRMPAMWHKQDTTACAQMRTMRCVVVRIQLWGR